MSRQADAINSQLNIS